MPPNRLNACSGPRNSPRNVARVKSSLAYRRPYMRLCIWNRRSKWATYPAVCSKRATLLGNVDRA